MLTTTLAADARNDCLVEMKAALAKRRVSGQNRVFSWPQRKSSSKTNERFSERWLRKTVVLNNLVQLERPWPRQRNSQTYSTTLLRISISLRGRSFPPYRRWQ